MTDRDERYAAWLARYFYLEGLDRDDLCQEARLAALLARPGCERIAARRRILDLLKMSQRRPRFVELEDDHGARDGIVDVVDARARLRAVIETDLTTNERRALGMTVSGEPIARDEKGLQVGLWRLRRKFAA